MEKYVSTGNTNGSYKKKIWRSIICFINRGKWSLLIIEVSLAFSAILKEIHSNSKKKYPKKKKLAAGNQFGINKLG